MMMTLLIYLSFSLWGWKERITTYGIKQSIFRWCIQND
jgi:hypothetical protein